MSRARDQALLLESALRPSGLSPILGKPLPVIEAIPAYLDRWGTHPSWSRMLGNPALYPQIETRLTELLGAPDSLVLPTLTHIHASVIPVLASDGTIFVDSRAHKTIWDGCVAARAHGAAVVRYAHDDPEAVERLLNRHARTPRLVCRTGVNSMPATPRAGGLPRPGQGQRCHAVRRRRPRVRGRGGAGPRGDQPLRLSRQRVVRHLGESYDNIVLTAGFSKAYSSLLAFVACPPELKRLLLEKLGAFTLNRSGFPIVEVALADADDLAKAGRFLLDQGI